MLEPDWNSIDVDAIKVTVRDYIEQGHDPDGQVVAHKQREDAHLVVVKTSPASMWGLLSVSSARDGRPFVFTPQLLDLNAEHTITHGSVAEAKGLPPRVHYLAIRAPGVTSARARLAPEDWETLTPTRGWLLDIRAEQYFEAVPDYEYLDPQLGWSSL